jgi:hypothetical protein
MRWTKAWRRIARAASLFSRDADREVRARGFNTAPFQGENIILVMAAAGRKPRSLMI